MSMMDETIEQIVKAAKEAVNGYGGDNQYMILEEVCRWLQKEGQNALMLEYMREEVMDNEQ